MSNPDLHKLEAIAKSIAKNKLAVNGDIAGTYDTYELVSYIDEVVILDSLGQEIISIPKQEDDDT